MGSLAVQKKVKLITSVIFRDEALCVAAVSGMENEFGPVEKASNIMPFDYTDYYEKEMGSGLNRRFFSFRVPVDKGGICRVKLFTNELENALSPGGKRRVNIDPGYVTEAKLVLLTTKDYTHRIYIGNNIFAEVTLFYENGTFNAWPWTYPDYASTAIIEYFNGIRRQYMENTARRPENNFDRKGKEI